MKATKWHLVFSLPLFSMKLCCRVCPVYLFDVGSQEVMIHQIWQKLKCKKNTVSILLFCWLHNFKFLTKHDGLIPTCITAHASRTCRDACRDRSGHLCNIWECFANWNWCSVLMKLKRRLHCCTVVIKTLSSGDINQTTLHLFITVTSSWAW